MDEAFPKLDLVRRLVFRLSGTPGQGKVLLPEPMFREARAALMWLRDNNFAEARTFEGGTADFTYLGRTFAPEPDQGRDRLIA